MSERAAVITIVWAVAIWLVAALTQPWL